MQQTPDFCCPCGGFLGWKQIRLGGKSLSKSYSDLRLLGTTHSKGWAWDTSPPSVGTFKPRPLGAKKQMRGPGSAPIERLPPEILGKTVSFFFFFLFLSSPVKCYPVIFRLLTFEI